MKTVLDIENLTVHYGHSVAVSGVSLTVGEGELVTLVGANGAGKTTILRTVMGLHRPTQGSIRYQGRDVAGLRPWVRSRMGVVMIPEGRRIFPELTVLENLRIGAYARTDRDGVAADLEKAYAMFPILRERAGQIGRTLSGGQQQMLAIARALVARPKLLLVDEISLGLAPILVDEVFRAVETLHREGVTIFLVEQNARKALEIADRGYVLSSGRLVLEGTAAELRANPEVKKSYLGG
ncbi:MAG: ABC transporter ATP-binding protein [Bacillota bacterium]